MLEQYIAEAIHADRVREAEARALARAALDAEPRAYTATPDREGERRRVRRPRRWIWFGSPT